MGAFEDIVRQLVENNGKRVSSLPFFTRGPKGEVGRLNRQCTYEYKIAPVRAWISDHLKQRKMKKIALVQMGISMDEYMRMKPSGVKWAQNKYPLIDKKMTRSDCEKWLNSKGFPVPPKSSCLGCPFRSNESWRALKANSPEEWEQTCEVDDKIRRLPGVSREVFLHRSAVPLRQAFLGELEGQGALNFWNEECSGSCGV